MHQIYFDVTWEHEANTQFLDSIKTQTPDSSGVWGDVEAVESPDDADYYVAFGYPSDDLDPSKRLVFCAEPPCHYPRRKWNAVEAKRKFFVADYYKPQRWWIDRTYDELVALDSPEKTKDLSWITSDKGRHMNPLERVIRESMLAVGFRKFQRKRVPLLDRGPHDGHILRMAFLDRLTDELPDLLDLYGRGDFGGAYYRGEIEDKWDGLADYRYTLAVENYKGTNYFSEKISDALLAWCMPIYWGCTNIPDLLPEDSYVWIDIEDEDAPERVREVVESDLRERNIDAIAEARERILEERQIWPTVERAVTTLTANPDAELDNTYQQIDTQ